MHPLYGAVCLLHSHHSSRSEQLTARLTVRLSEDEVRQVKLAAQIYGVSPSELVRHAAAGLPMPTPPPPKLDAEVAQELRRIGTNVNQAVAVLNRVYRSAESDQEVIVEARSMATRLIQLEGLLNEVRQRQIGVDPHEEWGS